MPWRENKGVANLNGIYTDGLGLLTQEILEEIFLKNGRGPEMLWIHGAHGGHGFFLVAYGKKSLEEIFFEYCASTRNIFNYPRT